MKKLLFVLGFLTVVAVGSTQAQARLGGAFSYGTGIEEFGLNLNGEFFLKDELAIAPGFTYFFTEDPISFWDLNANVNYYFVNSGAASVYALGGINLATQSIDFGGQLGNASATEFGLNLGIGSNFEVGGNVLPYAQLRVVLGDFDQAVLDFGVKFGI